MKKIILVEDDEFIVDALSMYFKTLGLQLLTYKDGTSILEGKSEVPDLFLLDKNLPVMDGLNLCRFIKRSETYRHVPVVIVSASSHLDESVREAGAEGWLAKPFQLDRLNYTLMKYLETEIG